MIDLPDVRELSPERTQAVREQLLTVMRADPLRTATRAPVRRARPVVVAALLVVLLVGAGLAAAVALTLTAAQQDGPGAVVVGAGPLAVLYDGRRITQDDLVALTKDGRGTFTATDIDTERDLGATRAFDTLAELDAYSAAYVAWQKARAAGHDVEAWGTVRP